MSRKVVSVLEVVALFLLIVTSASAQQPRLRTLTEQELADMMLGVAIQSSRGDNTAAHVAELKRAIAQGKKFQMISLEDLPDDWTIVSTGDVGGGGAWPHVQLRTEQQKLPEVSIPYGGNVILEQIHWQADSGHNAQRGGWRQPGSAVAGRRDGRAGVEAAPFQNSLRLGFSATY